MLSDKEIKIEFKKKASKEPDKYYATNVLISEGFERKKCKCGTYFWAVDNDVCGKPECSGGFRFIGNSPASQELSYIDVWKRFSNLFKKWGYTPIKRYPCVARWRDDVYWVGASIYNFQPYVVSGEVEPPANPLVVPQICLRFNDIDNIGITGAHYCAFVMIGQHAFMSPEEWDQEKFFTDIYNWLKIGLGLKKEEIIFHEDAWAGGGNFGPCMEYFSRGLELGNQVYMMYEITHSGYKELNIKVLDMGMGHERNAWFTKGTSTSYETTFPTVCRRLYNLCGIKIDEDLMRRFLPYSSYLNIDEIDDINKVWSDIAKKINEDVKVLKRTIYELAAIYSIAEHTRALLVAITDGALPSNVGGGYNLRVILRRALSFIDKYDWNVDLLELCELHAKYLKPLFPELMEQLSVVDEILKIEKVKYKTTKEKTRQLISKLIKQNIDTKKLLYLYDSHGITPEIIKEEGKKLGKEIIIPENFYAQISILHEKKEQKHATTKENKLELKGLPETKILYYEDYLKTKFKAKVIKIVDNKVVLDKTAFYPTSGGQLHDTGKIDALQVMDVYKQGNIIVHVLETKPEFELGQEVSCEINFERRKQLTQHHTATHIINASARRILGQHINQAGAKKSLDKAHLDITHYRKIKEEELRMIEKEANRIASLDLPIKKFFMLRNVAEKKYGMRLYQGGAVPGKLIRIVEIPNVDVEACGGTHLNRTKEVEKIKILKSVKIQDGIVRIIFVAGSAAKKEEKKAIDILIEAAKLLGVEPEEVPARAEELFMKWKKARKALKKGRKIDAKELELVVKKRYDGEILKKTAEILKTQPEYITNTIKRFLQELKEFKEKCQ